MKALLRRRGLAYAIIVSVVVLCFFLVSAFHSPLVRQMHRWRLLPQPETLTELYFTNSPSTTYRTDTAQTIVFTTHNLEHKQVTYTYSIRAQNDTGTTSQEFAAGSFVLADGASKDTSIPVTLPRLSERMKVSVVLTNDQQTINYWVKEGQAHDQENYRPNSVP